jgi:hypothetical protein
MLKQALRLIQHLCEHPSPLAAADKAIEKHAELQDWKSLLQTRMPWSLQGDLAPVSD